MRFRHILRQAALAVTFSNSGTYWERRYRAGLTSGSGSYGPLATFKAEVLNDFVDRHGVRTVAEFGCGDGNQLSLAQYPSYLGLDVSRTAIDTCRECFRHDPTKSFLWYDPLRTVNLDRFVQVDLTLSLDVIYHLVEEEPYRKYLTDLFSMSRRYVIAYSSDFEGRAPLPHIRHRNFTADLKRDFPAFRLIERIDNRYPENSLCSFFIYERSGA